MTTNNQKLAKIMNENKMNRRDVARLLSRPIDKRGTCNTVANWLANPSSGCYRKMPDHVFAAFEFRMSKLTAAERKAFEGPTDRSAISTEVWENWREKNPR